MSKLVPDTPHAPAPIGPYSVATEANGFVFISGQIPIDPATGAPVEGPVSMQTRRIMDNLAAILGDLGLGFADVVKTTIFLADMQDFPAVNQVYGEYFSDAPPARATVEVGGLPGGFDVEIEAIVARS
jgi:2-iminobutanoate/2-iminopropanoate deaminase